MSDNAEAGHRKNWFVAMLRQRCPRCREGKIFRNLLDMHERCPVCDLKWEKEQGYFLGAMYFSYALAIAFLLAAYLLIQWLLPGLHSMWAATLALVCFLPVVPFIFRWSRVLWIWFDHWAWPGTSRG